MSKLRAFLTHFSISATVVGVALGVIFFVWYPAPFFQVAGAWDVVRILIGVDLILGPLLTLILFRSGKPGLVFDLSIVALIQITALTYGLSAIYEERPYFVVFAVDRFEVLARKDVDESEITDDRLRHKDWTQPIYSVASLPDSFAARQQLIQDVVDGKPDIERRPEFWSPYTEKSDVVRKAAKPLLQFSRERPDAAAAVKRFIKTRRDGDRLIGLPVIGKQGAYIIVLEPEQIKPVGLIPVDPWNPPPESAPTEG